MKVQTVCFIAGYKYKYVYDDKLNTKTHVLVP